MLRIFRNDGLGSGFWLSSFFGTTELEVNEPEPHYIVIPWLTRNPYNLSGVDGFRINEDTNQLFALTFFRAFFLAFLAFLATLRFAAGFGWTRPVASSSSSNESSMYSINRCT